MNGAFRWICLAVGTLTALVLIWAAISVRAQFAEIAENSKKGTATLVQVADDLRDLRDLAGISNNGSNASFSRYARHVIELVAKEKGAHLIPADGGRISQALNIAKEVISGKEEPLSLDKWTVRARRHALWLVFTCESRKEILDGLCQTGVGQQWMIQIPGKEPLPLIDWVKQHDPESQKLDADG